MTARVVAVSALLVCFVHALRVVSVAQQAASPSSSAVTPKVEPAKRITAYTLSPDLYRKAHFLSRIRFASRIFGLLYGVFVLWLSLQRLWSAKFRDWAEAACRRGFVQALIYTSLLVLTIGLLMLPLDVFDESILKRYGITVQTWGSWIGTTGF
jgi:STE24 endopeptidase